MRLAKLIEVAQPSARPGEIGGPIRDVRSRMIEAKEQALAEKLIVPGPSRIGP